MRERIAVAIILVFVASPATSFASGSAADRQFIDLNALIIDGELTSPNPPLVDRCPPSGESEFERLHELRNSFLDRIDHSTRTPTFD